MKKSRQSKWACTRIDWDEHRQLKIFENKFHTEYHMTHSTFEKLVDILCSDLCVDSKQSICSTNNNPICAERCVAIGLQFLGGAPVNTLTVMFGISYTVTHTKINQFLNAVNNNRHFDIDVPRTDSELQKCADDWNDLLSAHGVFDGCIGAIDGWLCCINTPNKRLVHNPVHYFSGHYQQHGELMFKLSVMLTYNFFIFGLLDLEELMMRVLSMAVLSFRNG
jgi:hypothetical protein